MLKTLLKCSVAALAGVLIAKLLLAQSLTTDNLPTMDGKPGTIKIEGGVSGVWFTIGRVNKSDPHPSGTGAFDPSQTYMISDFQPVIKKMKNGKFLIQFECNICQDLP